MSETKKELKKLKIGETRFEEIPLELLKEAPYNVPGRTTGQSMDELAADIGQHGIYENLIVIEPEGDDPKHEIVCGNRRFKAAKMAGRPTRLPCVVWSSDTPEFERQTTNWGENVHRRGLSYDEKYLYVAKIMKAYNDNVEFVAQKCSWSVDKVMEILKYGQLDKSVKAHVSSPEEYRYALATSKLTPEKSIELMKLARSKLLSGRTVKNLADHLEKSPDLPTQKVYDEMEEKGTRITIPLDGVWHTAVKGAIAKFDTTKQAYAEEALKRRLVDDGFDPRKQEGKNGSPVEK